MNLNKAMIIGNLTRDPEIKTTPGGLSVAAFSVATSLKWTDNNGQKMEKAEFHNIVAWRKLADICGQYLRKGSKIYIEGRLQTRDWTGQDGVKRYRTEIIAEDLIMLSPTQQTKQTSEPMPVPGPEYGEYPQESDDEEIRVENIPF